MNLQLSYALSAGAALAELRFERRISSEASVKTEGFSLTSTESHARGRGPAPLRCQPGSSRGQTRWSAKQQSRKTRWLLATPAVRSTRAKRTWATSVARQAQHPFSRRAD